MNILKNKSSSIKDLLALVTLAVLIIVGLLIGPGSFGTLVAATDSSDNPGECPEGYENIDNDIGGDETLEWKADADYDSVILVGGPTDSTGNNQDPDGRNKFFDDVKEGNLLEREAHNISHICAIPAGNENGGGGAVNDEPDPDPKYATIIAHKIVCEDENDMPQNGLGDKFQKVEEYTAYDWVSGENSCRLEDDWYFQWAPEGAQNPGDDFYGEAEGPWTTFGTTTVNGKATVQLFENDIDGMSHIWIREVLQTGYIPFTYGLNDNSNTDDYSAEMYCHTDVLNYDNYERIDGIEVNNTYYCVAWNMKIDDNGYDNGNGNGNGEENGNGNGEGENGNGDDPDNGDGDDDSGSQTPPTTSSGGGSGALVYAGETTEPTPEGLVAGIEDTTESSESSTVDQPEGQVAGEEVSIMPLGAPDTGMGGTSPGSNNGAWPVTLAIMMILTTAFINLKSLFA